MNIDTNRRSYSEEFKKRGKRILSSIRLVTRKSCPESWFLPSQSKLLTPRILKRGELSFPGHGKGSLTP